MAPCPSATSAAATATSASLGTPSPDSAAIAPAAASNPETALTSRIILSMERRSAPSIASIARDSGSGRAARTALLRQPPGLRQSSASCDIGSLALVGASP